MKINSELQPKKDSFETVEEGIVLHSENEGFCMKVKLTNDTYVLINLRSGQQVRQYREENFTVYENAELIIK